MNGGCAMGNSARMTRRSALCFIGGGTVVAASSRFETFGFSNLTAVRRTTVKTADDSDALLGLFVPDSIERKGRSLLVEITNNLATDIDGTVSLSTDDHENVSGGTLYGPSGDSGVTVSFSLAASTESSSDTATIEIDPNNYEGRIPFTIVATASDSRVSFEATRETESMKNPDGSGVTITNSGQFKVRHSRNYWQVKKVAVTSDEFRLDRVEYEVSDSSNSVVGTHVDGASGTTYTSGDIRIDPDDGQVSKGDYTLRITAYDRDGNYDIAITTN